MMNNDEGRKVYCQGVGGGGGRYSQGKFGQRCASKALKP